jgi:hypothetical protein
VEEDILELTSGVVMTLTLYSLILLEEEIA